MIAVAWNPPPTRSMRSHFKLMTRRTWVTADGRRVPVSRMSLFHAAAAVRMLRKRAEVWLVLQELKALAQRPPSPSKGGDDAAWDLLDETDPDSTADELLTRLCPPYAAMLRKLELARVDPANYARPREAIETSSSAGFWDSDGECS